MAVKVHQLLKPMPSVGRKWRSPTHRWSLETKPYQIQPFVIAPVLPGDTLKAGMFQARVVSDPIANPIMGWHKEYYWFYVKLTDLNIRDQVPDMFLSEAYTGAGLVRAADAKTYHAGGAVDWTYHCLQRVVETYFRDEGEAWNVAMLDGMPLAQAFGREDAWTDSLANDDSLPETTDSTNEIGELYGEQYAKWEGMRKLGLVTVTFPEYLEKVYGVSLEQEKVKPYRPELLRYAKQWTYPTNHVNPADGSPSSAVVWTVQERIDKNRYMKEPGFIFGVTVTRPKVYMKNQAGSAVQLLTKGERWLPTVVLADEPHASVINVPGGTGPIPGITDDGGYWVDLVDLFHYGEQFVNYSTATAAKNMVSLPTTGLAGGSTKYATTGDIDALFKVAANNKLREDGVADLKILSRITDTTK